MWVNENFRKLVDNYNSKILLKIMMIKSLEKERKKKTSYRTFKIFDNSKLIIVCVGERNEKGILLLSFVFNIGNGYKKCSNA